MAKGDKKKKEEQVGTVPEISIFKNTDNSPKIHIPPDKLQSILEYFNTGGEFDVVPLECQEEQLQVIINSNTNNLMGHYKGMPVDTEVVNEGYFIFEVKKILDIISKKYKKSKMLHISWMKGGKIDIQDDKGSPVSISSKALTTISNNIPALNRRITYEESILQFNKKIKKNGKVVTEVDEDGDPVTEDAATKITITQSELMRAKDDMIVAGVDYVVLNFEQGHSYSESGTWTKKGDTSRTDDLDCEVEGPALNKSLPKEFFSVINKLSGDIDIQGTMSKPIIGVSQFLGAGGENAQEMHYNIAQNKRRE